MRAIVLSILAVILLTPMLSAQTASYSYFGTGYSATPPFLVTGTPTLGGTITVQTHGTYSGLFEIGQSVLIIGISDEIWGPLSLPFNLTGVGGPLLVSVDLLIPVPTALYPATLVSIPVAIPNDPILLGLHFYQQVVQVHQTCFKFGCSPATVSLTRGGHGVIGY